MNPEFDALLERVLQDRADAGADPGAGTRSFTISRTRSRSLGLYYNPAAGAVADRLLNVSSEWPGPVHHLERARVGRAELTPGYRERPPTRRRHLQ